MEWNMFEIFDPYKDDCDYLPNQVSQSSLINNTSNSTEEINSAMAGLCISSSNNNNNNTYDNNHSWMSPMDPIEELIMYCDNVSNYINDHRPLPLSSTVAMAKHRFGCEFLQEEIEEGNPTRVATIFAEVKDYLHELIIHPFGSYLIEKIFQANTITYDQKISFVLLIISNIEELRDVCIDNHGTRVIQTMLENITCPIMKSAIVYTIKYITVELMKNVNGGYVIVQCLKFSSIEDQKVILDEIARNCVDIFTDKIGCSVIQKCIDHDGINRARALLLKEITSNAMVLAEDPYGNYVLKFVIKMKLWITNETILEKLRGNFVRLSMNKYASNVVEDMLRCSNQNNVAVIVKEIMRSRDFFNVLKDPFGNYVAQTALEYTEGHLRRALSDLIKSNHKKLDRHPYGKRVLAMAKAMDMY